MVIGNYCIRYPDKFLSQIYFVKIEIIEQILAITDHNLALIKAQFALFINSLKYSRDDFPVVVLKTHTTSVTLSRYCQIGFFI